MNALLRLIPYFRQSWSLLAGTYVSLLLTSLLTLAVPMLLGIAVDRGIAQQDPGALAAASAAIIAVSLGRGLFAFTQGYFAEAAAQAGGYALRKELYAHLQRLSFSFHDQAQTGELMARATADVEAIRQFSGRGLASLVGLVMLIVGVVLSLLRMDPLLALLSLTILPALVWRTDRFSRSIRPMYRAVQNELASLAAMAQENAAGVRVVRAFGREADEIVRFNRQNERLFEEYVRTARETARNAPFLDLLANSSTLLLVWTGGVLVMTGHLSIGGLVAFYSYLLALAGPIRRGGWLMATASRASASAERIFEVVDTPVTVGDRPGAVSAQRLDGRVEFQDVSCAYHPGRPVIAHVSFRAEPGQTVALVGSTGSGKTTVANLIPRFYDVSEGRVLVDGLDVRDVQLQSLRAQVGLVMQETFLFSGSIRENIAFGRPDASEAEVEHAARVARAEEFIQWLPEGYETIVGERGVSLSGGQKQRIAIARAVLTDPRILILDEFSSSVDLETERLIREALDAVRRNRTTFIIAHRLATVRTADQILVLKDGRLVAVGTHAELLRHNDEYRAIYAAQIEAEADGSPADAEAPAIPVLQEVAG